MANHPNQQPPVYPVNPNQPKGDPSRVDRTDDPIPLPDDSLPKKGEKLDEEERSDRVERQG